MNKKLVLSACAVLFAASYLCATDVYLGIQAKGRRIDLGLSEFDAGQHLIQEEELGAKIRDVVLDDLNFSLYFNIHESGELLVLGDQINFKPWRDMQSDVLVTGSVLLKNNFMDIEIKAYDVESGQNVWVKRFYSSRFDYRSIAHKISNEIVLRFTGEEGIAESKITFVNDSSGNKEVYIADYDGHNIKRLTYNKSIALFPRLSPDRNDVCFTSYHHDNPDLFVVSSDGIVIRSVSVRQGLNTSARWSPDGSQIVLTLSMGKSPDIYLINLQGRVIDKLTSGWGAEVSPCFSPDGKEIVYTSDSPGYPQIYKLDLERKSSKRIVSGRYADSPVWSPRGDRIAFSMLSENGTFDIYSIDINGRNTVQLTGNAGKNENPSWSPDGRFIIFTTTRSWKKELYVMAADGSMQRRLINLKGDTFTPDWR